MSFTKNTSLGNSAVTNAVLRCKGTHMCAAVQSCGTGFDTATINAENYEAVKTVYSNS